MDLSLKFPFFHTSDRDRESAVLGREKALMVDTMHGRYAQAVARGNVYIGASASGGIALIVPAATGGHPTLFNPKGSGVLLSVIKLTLGYVSGNNAPTCIEWALSNNCGAQPATGASGQLLTATKVAPVNARIGAPDNSKGYWSPTTNTFTAAPTFFATSGVSLFTGVAATAVAPFSLEANYDGALMVEPGNAISLCTQAATTTALFQVTVWWEEIPL